VRDLITAGMRRYRIRKEAHVQWHTMTKIEARMQAGIPVPEAHDPPAIPRWRTHDVRRTFRTRLSECGVDRHIAEMLVGHIGHRNVVERVYDRHEYWAEKRTALVKWQDKLRSIIEGTAEKIVAPKFGRRSA
jgi:hypothetical protein